MAPFFTKVPESKETSRMAPGSSEPTVTPRKATRVPLADWMGCQRAASTWMEVTASGGGTKALPALIIVPICIALTPTSTPTTATRPRPTAIQSLVFVVMGERFIAPWPFPQRNRSRGGGGPGMLVLGV